jgi:hypothetical protein
MQSGSCTATWKTRHRESGYKRTGIYIFLLRKSVVDFGYEIFVSVSKNPLSFFHMLWLFFISCLLCTSTMTPETHTYYSPDSHMLAEYTAYMLLRFTHPESVITTDMPGVLVQQFIAASPDMPVVTTQESPAYLTFVVKYLKTRLRHLAYQIRASATGTWSIEQTHQFSKVCRDEYHENIEELCEVVAGYSRRPMDESG